MYKSCFVFCESCFCLWALGLYYSPSQWWEMLLPQEYIHAAAYPWLLENLQKPITGGEWGNAKSWMCCCLWDAALGSLPIWIVGSRRDWALIHPELPARQECQEEASPKATCTGSAPSQPILGSGETSRYLAITCTVFFLSDIFFLKTTRGNKLVLEGRVLSLGSFWLEIYFSVHVLCSCTWQSGVCSAVHSPANLVS